MQNFVITPKLVHKDSADDVLLNHPRPALPLQIEKSTAYQWEQAGFGCLLALYQPHKENNALLRLALVNGNQGLTSSFGKTIPLDPAWEPYRALPYQIIEAEFSASHADILQQLESLYANVNKTDHPIAELFRSTSYKMINQADHYFFYRKDHEHMPGIMLIEAQRQAVYTHVYTMTQHIRGDVTVSLDKLHCEFYGYVDLMYPLELVVDDLQEERHVRAKKITYRVAFFQRGKLVALIDSVVNIIDMNQFKRLRNLFIYEKNDHCYAPIHANKVHCKLVDAENKEYSAKCVSVSRDKCLTTYDNVSIDNIRTIKVSSNGFTFSSAIELESHSKKNAVWRFPHLNQEQLSNLAAIIKRGFILKNKEK
jgi:hypothetical protein